MKIKKIASCLITAALILSSLVFAASCGTADAEGTADASSVAGKWEADFSYKDILTVGESDAGAVFEALGMDLSAYRMKLTFEFKQNGEVTIGTDPDEAKETAKSLFGEFIDLCIDASGAAEEEYLASQGYASRDEALDDMMGNTDFSSFNGKTAKYKQNGDVLEFGKTKIKIETSDDTLVFKEVLEKADDGDTDEFIEKFIPMTLKRIK